jgi:hypothetical protein
VSSVGCWAVTEFDRIDEGDDTFPFLHEVDEDLAEVVVECCLGLIVVEIPTDFMEDEQWEDLARYVRFEIAKSRAFSPLGVEDRDIGMWRDYSHVGSLAEL